MESINWNEVVVDCPNHGWLCSMCKFGKKVKLKKASDRTKAGILLNRYGLKKSEIKQIIGKSYDEVVPNIAWYTTYQF